jgi:hypothetical protein
MAIGLTQIGLDPIHLISIGFSPIGNVSDQDPYVFGPLGSGSFHQQAKKGRKTLISAVCDSIMTRYL